MQILKKGTNPVDKTYDGTCACCKTEVRFKRSEGNVVSDPRDGDYVSVRCPICGNPINVAMGQGR